MVNKALRIVLYSIFTISLLFVVPFNNIHADTISNSNVNINYYLDSVTETTTGTYMQTYKVEFVFDQSYLGWISSKMVGTYIDNNTVPMTTSQFTKTQAIYVNGTIAETSFTFITPNTMNGGALQSLSQSIQNSNVTPLADLSTLDDILNILTDINNNVEIDVLDELQNIVSNTSLTNDYLDKLTQLRYWNVPIESYSSMFYLLKNHEVYDFNDLYDLQYPTFELQTNEYVFQRLNYTYETYTWIFVTSGNIANINVPNDPSYLGNWFKFYDNSGNEITPTFSNFTMIDRSLVINDNQVGKMIKVDFNISTNHIQFYYCKYIKNQSSLYIPIYLNINSNKNISTDFAIRFGLSNRLLDDIRLIANGTNASSAASSQSDQANSQLQQDSNTLFQQEDSFKQDMNYAMQNIDTTFSLNNFGSSFMTSAQWVRTQYETLTNNTPFASLITFSLLVGLALIVIGKVYK